MKKLITLFLVLALVITTVIFFGYQWYSNAVYSENISSETIEFIVKDGDNLITLSDELSEKGLIVNSEVLKIYLRLNDVNPNIKAGIYSINKGTNLPNLIKILEEGTFKASIIVTIPEGLRLEAMGDILEEKFLSSGSESRFVKSEFLDIARNPDSYNFSLEVQSILSSIKPSSKPLLGFLFPDTYIFDFDSNAQTVIEKLILNFNKRLVEAGINDNLFTPDNELDNLYEALILASILEWEGGASDNLNLVAGVFNNRLRINLPLQADSTVNFITGKSDPGVLISDTLIDSPYNTYKYAGLPPTPISNPGIRSILGAMKPEKTEFLYFLHDANGKIYFAVTYDQHLNNVRRYL